MTVCKKCKKDFIPTPGQKCCDQCRITPYLCSCGCGEQIYPYLAKNNTWHWPKYKKGHFYNLFGDKKGKIIECSNCKTQKYFPRWRLEKINMQNYICQMCRNNTSKIVSCYQCGKLIKVPQYKLKTRRWHFCSLDCYRNSDVFNEICKHKSEDFHKNYSSAFYRIKPFILDRDGHFCQNCLSKNYLVVHHINGMKHDNIPSNLITLCRSCNSQEMFNRWGGWADWCYDYLCEREGEEKYNGDYKDYVIAGCDESGVGSLISSVYAVCFGVVGTFFPKIDKLNDSKKLFIEEREYVYSQIENYVNKGILKYTMGIASLEEVDKLNVENASKLAMERAVNAFINTISSIDLLYVDWRKLNVPVSRIISEAKADSKYHHVMGASIVAKVLRDRYIKSLVKEFPEYKKFGWETNIGYGTKKHIEAIRKYGITPLHRKTFEPIKTWLKERIVKNI